MILVLAKYLYLGGGRLGYIFKDFLKASTGPILTNEGLFLSSGPALSDSLVPASPSKGVPGS